MTQSKLGRSIASLFSKPKRPLSQSDRETGSGSVDTRKGPSIPGVPLRRGAGIMRIESRLLFDGAVGVTADALAPEPEHKSESLPVESTVRTQKPTDDPINGDLPNLDNSQVELASPDIVVFIDERLADREQLLAGTPADTHVVVIHANRSGVDQMAQALDGLAGVQSVHIISTGEPGRLNLGGSVLTVESIRGEYSEQLAHLGGSLSETADILIYGDRNHCDGSD